MTIGKQDTKITYFSNDQGSSQKMSPPEGCLESYGSGLTAHQHQQNLRVVSPSSEEDQAAMNFTVAVEKARSLIHHFPLELLAPIFLLATPDLFFLNPHTATQIPFLYVCKWWYNVAISTAGLWCRFLLNHAPLPILERERLSLWISRSKNAPLSISCSWMEGMEEAWSMLLEHAPRWKVLRYAGNMGRPLQQYLSLTRKESKLEFFRWRKRRRAVYIDLPIPRDVLDNVFLLPKLTSVKISGRANLPAALAVISGPGVYCLTLFRCNLSATDFTTLSKSFPKLRVLVLDKVEIYDADIESAAPMESLESLAWKTPTYVHFNFRVLSKFPCLRRLSLSSKYLVVANPVFLPRIQELNCWFNTWAEASDIRNLFSLFPNLSSLRLVPGLGYGYSKDLVEALAGPTWREMLLKNLKHLIIEGIFFNITMVDPVYGESMEDDVLFHNAMVGMMVDVCGQQRPDVRVHRASRCTSYDAEAEAYNDKYYG